MEFLKRIFQKKPRVHKVNVQQAYQLHNRVGQGSMSRVWKATDPNSQNLVAVKVLDKEQLAKFNARFQPGARPIEGDIAISLNHPNVVKTLSHGITTEDEEFLIMEYIDGDAMTSLIEAQNKRMKKHCLSYAIQLGEAIDYLHANKWIYRDLCPRNVMVDNNNRVKVIDFGLMVPNTPYFRKPGNRTGTANYMAPELIKRQPTDERIDIYAYSVMCFEMFTGELPWPASDSLESVLHHINSPPKEIKELNPEIDDQVANAIMKGLERDPNQRWQTMRLMINELQAARNRIKANR